MLNKALSFGTTLITLSLCATLSSGVVVATPSAEVESTASITNLQPPAPSPQSPTSGITPAAGPTIAGCPTFPADNVWNARVDWLPVDSRSNAYINSIGANTGLHADFGSGIYGDYGIPYTITTGAQISVTITFPPEGYEEESDAGPYPIPPDAPIEGGPSSTGDRHVLVVEKDHCLLYEMYHSYPQGDGSWEIYSGAVYNLNSNALREDGWTSADAAGLPILPGLARCDEIQAGAINHALRFTANDTQDKYIWPARHEASSNPDPNVPPMGQRFRLKSSFNTSGFSSDTQIILNALKTYGMILADNGSDWYISGAPGSCWDDDTLVDELEEDVRGSDFEAVDESFLMLNPDSGQVLIFTPTDWLFMPLVRR